MPDQHIFKKMPQSVWLSYVTILMSFLRQFGDSARIDITKMTSYWSIFLQTKYRGTLNDCIHEYIQSLDKELAAGNTTEHTIVPPSKPYFKL